MNLPLQIEITLFFQENIFVIETLENIAFRIGKRPEELKKTIEYLTSVSIIERIGEDEKPLYRYILPKCNQKIQFV